MVQKETTGLENTGLDWVNMKQHIVHILQNGANREFLYTLTF